MRSAAAAAGVDPELPPLLAGLPRGRGGAVVAVLVGGTAAAAGVGIVHLAGREAERVAAGDSVGPLGTALAQGSGPGTTLVTVVAGALFALSARRVRRGPLEPPVAPAAASVGALRAALRRELTIARTLLTVTAVVACLEAGRLMATLAAASRGGGPARDTWAWTLAESAGVALATTSLVAWCLAFRAHCRRLGAL